MFVIALEAGLQPQPKMKQDCSGDIFLYRCYTLGSVGCCSIYLLMYQKITANWQSKARQNEPERYCVLGNC